MMSGKFDCTVASLYISDWLSVLLFAHLLHIPTDYQEEKEKKKRKAKGS